MKKTQNDSRHQQPDSRSKQQATKDGSSKETNPNNPKASLSTQKDSKKEGQNSMGPGSQHRSQPTAPQHQGSDSHSTSQSSKSSPASSSGSQSTSQSSKSSPSSLHGSKESSESSKTSPSSSSGSKSGSKPTKGLTSSEDVDASKNVSVMEEEEQEETEETKEQEPLKHPHKQGVPVASKEKSKSGF